MVYRPEGRKTYRTTVRDKAGRTRECSCGTQDVDVAEDVDATVQRWRRHRRWEVLDAIVAGRVPLADAYDAECRGTLDALLEDRAALDLDPLVSAWAKAGAKANYVRDVRRLILPGVRFPLTEFRRGVIKAHLDALKSNKRNVAGNPTTGPDASGATKNRHKAAISAFAKYLIALEHLEENPTHALESYEEATPTERYYTEAQGQALVRALPSIEARALAALMANGIEWGALAHARRRDLDLETEPYPTLHLFPGFVAEHEGERKRGKNDARTNRVVELTEEWTHAYVRAWAAALPPNAPLVATLIDKRRSSDVFYRLQHRIARAIGLPEVKVHAWRHTYIRVAKDRDDDPDRIRNQVGHAANSPLLITRYGVRKYRPKSTRKTAAPTTEVPTTPETEREVRRAKS